MKALVFLLLVLPPSWSAPRFGQKDSDLDAELELEDGGVHSHEDPYTSAARVAVSNQTKPNQDDVDKDGQEGTESEDNAGKRLGRASPQGEYSESVMGCLKGLNNFAFNGITLEECKSICSAASSFACNSIDYNMKKRKCHLSTETKRSRPNAYHEPCYTETTWTIYLERKAIDGRWTEFSDWSVCSKTCGVGEQVRSRTCTNPPPSGGGEDCRGHSEEVQSCVDAAICPIDGRWTEFSDWGACSATCGEGRTVRTRSCTNPPPRGGGQDCVGHSGEWQVCVEVDICLSCRGGATLLSTSPGRDMVLCKDKTESTCEKDFESLCPAGWNLCHPKQFNNRNHGWDYNWEDAKAGRPLGVIYCRGGNGRALHYGIRSNPVLSTDQPLNCGRSSSRPGCELYAGQWDCDEKHYSALCCAPTSTCGDGRVQQEEDCDDGNDSNIDGCLNSCTWRKPSDHGLSGC